MAEGVKEVTYDLSNEQQEAIEELFNLRGWKLLSMRSGDPRNVIVTKLSVVVEGRPDQELDLIGDLEELKKQPIIMKEGTIYRLKLSFYVQREIVSGLRYHHSIHRKGIKTDKRSYMIGSYGPKEEVQTVFTPPDEAPKGMISRGAYVVKSKVIDDDKNVLLEWKWTMHVTKHWDD